MFGVSADADLDQDAFFRCSSWNCLSSGTCGVDTTIPKHVGTWVYVVVALGIFGGSFFLFIPFHPSTSTSSHIWDALWSVPVASPTTRPGAREADAVLAGTGTLGHVYTFLRC